MNSLPAELLSLIFAKLNNKGSFKLTCVRFALIRSPGLHYCYHVNTYLSANLQNMTHLTLNGDFNEQIDGLLPQSLTHLRLGDKFNQPVDKLPSTLVWLTFGKSFNKSVNSLPHTLKRLKFGDEFNQTVDALPLILMMI